jgi:hypothetical protein
MPHPNPPAKMFKKIKNSTLELEKLCSTHQKLQAEVISLRARANKFGFG